MAKRKKLIIISIGCTLSLACIILCSYLITHNRIIAKDNEPTNTAGTYYNNVLAVPPLPDKLTFAGEEVPLHQYWVREGLDRELTNVCYQHSTTLLCLKRAARYFPIIEKILKEQGVPEDIKYLCVTESSLSNAISPAKAVGFWQFIESTGKNYGLEINSEVDERYHIEKSTRAACRYLQGCKNRLGSWALAAAAYNMGEGGVKKQMTNQDIDNYWDMYFNPETARYVYRILAYKLLFENPHIYGVHVTDESKYQPIHYKEIEISSSIPDMYAFCKEQNITYRELKELNPWLRATKLTVVNKTYTIKVPVKEP
ncbi:MAG: lytic transglycosylase domain-containing protein [Bacteroidales bacterium]|nr:lytic transglycosylase domain-containing protein [Bacteroidales bacterium]